MVIGSPHVSSRRRNAAALVAALTLTTVAVAVTVTAAAPAADAAITGATLVNKLASRCLNVPGSTDGTRLTIADCNGSASQKFTSTAASEIQVTVGGAVKCLDANGGGTANGTAIIVWPCHGGADQKFTLTAANAISNTKSGRCLDVYGSATAAGTQVVLWDCKNGGNGSQTWTPNATPPPPPPPSGIAKAAPYLFMGWGNPPSPATVQSQTGVKWFTMAFILAQNGCNPAWDGQRPLTGGVDQTAINQIRAGGGDVIPSVSGYQGNKLGPACGTADALAGAYQKVVDAYGLKAIDIDIENSDEFESEAVQDRILNALKILKQRKPGITTILTFGTLNTGPNYWGTRLITQSKAIGAGIDIFTIMPFDFGGGANMYQSTVNAAEGLKTTLKTAYGWSDATAYTHMGISGMNGLSDQQELTSESTWTQIRDWAAARHLGRFTYWAVNRDRGCAGGGVQSSCSGIAQSDWAFTRITAGYNG
ncbi:MAG: hypothetical protein QOD41_1324 [Cryptosporangiaceae bacterium]|nr:hypothetical protein [Cryptosporangiaceae bacterium]